MYIFLIQVKYCLADTLVATVSINQNITGILGSTETQLTCSLFNESAIRILSVQIIAKNITESFDDVKRPIAIFRPERAALLHPSGEYLSGRVTLTNITTASTNATITFHKLECTDEKDYMCEYYYINMDASFLSQESEQTRILVKGIILS